MCNCVLPGLRGCLSRDDCESQGSNHQSVLPGIALTSDKRTVRKKATVKWLTVKKHKFRFFCKDISYDKARVRELRCVSNIGLFSIALKHVLLIKRIRIIRSIIIYVFH